MSTTVAARTRSDFTRRRLSWTLAGIALVFAALILAVGPLLWLVRTWQEPAYDSDGFVVAALVALLGLWSVFSPVIANSRPAPRHAVWLLLASGLVRLAGQVTAINVLGALTLIVDLYALGVLTRLDQRQRAISPGWLAVAFAFSLPLERILQRALGYGLQQISADGACQLLSGIYGNVSCSGVRIIIAGRDVLVDLPCSGARTLLLTALAFALACALIRPNWRMALTGALLTLLVALLANILRITVLAIGIAFPETLGGIDVMAQPWHDTIGYAAMLLGLAPMVLWIRYAGRPTPIAASAQTDAAPKFSVNRELRVGAFDGLIANAHLTGGRAVLLAGAALFVAVVIVNLPRKAIDVANTDLTLSAPAWLLQHRAHQQPLTASEASYFTAYGGTAVKASYGQSSLLLVRTSSPLRHLHAPDECLRGLGFTVDYRGLSFDPVETAHYHATAPDGTTYRVDVTFASDKRHATGSVATAVWHWLRGDARQWTTIERISPMTISLAEHRAFSAAALFSLGIEPVAARIAPAGAPAAPILFPEHAPPHVPTSNPLTTKG